MSVQKLRSISYYPTMRLTIDGNTVEIGVYKKDGSAIHVRKSAASRLPEILLDVQQWIMLETEVVEWLAPPFQPVDENQVRETPQSGIEEEASE